MTTMELVHQKLVEDQRRASAQMLTTEAVEGRKREGAARGRSQWAYGKGLETSGGGWDRSRS